MIIKKIVVDPARRKAKVRHAEHVRSLVDYMREPDKLSPYREHLLAYIQETHGRDASADRLQYIGSRNFVSTDLSGQRAEMMATADAAYRSPNPLDHWLLSWPAGEVPKREEIEETVDIFLEVCGVAEHQCIFAVHGDTHNRHLHLALDRYDPITERVVTLGDGWITGAPHQAIALIEQRFGWKPEEGALYRVEGGQAVPTDKEVARRASGEKRIGRGPAAFEVRTGRKSAQRFARDEALPVILAAADWKVLHSTLAENGFRYEPVGINGAKLYCDGEYCNASDVSRDITLTRLVAKLGPFEPPRSDFLLSRGENADLMPMAFRADEYRAFVEERRENARGQINGRRDAMRTVDEQLAEAMTHSRKLDWSGSEDEQKTIEAVLGIVARRRAREEWSKARRVPPDFESWLLDQGEQWFAERWRNRRRPPDFAIGIEGVPGRFRPHAVDGYSPLEAWDGPEFCHRYARDGERTAFIARTTRIDVVPGCADEAIVAALKIALEKFPDRLVLRGSEDMRRRIYVLAVQHDLANRIEPLGPVADAAGLHADPVQETGAVDPLLAEPRVPSLDALLADVIGRGRHIVLDERFGDRVSDIIDMSPEEKAVLLNPRHPSNVSAVLISEGRRQREKAEALLRVVATIGDDLMTLRRHPNIAADPGILRILSHPHFIAGWDKARETYERSQRVGMNPPAVDPVPQVPDTVSMRSPPADATFISSMVEPRAIEQMSGTQTVPRSAPDSPELVPVVEATPTRVSERKETIDYELPKLRMPKTTEPPDRGIVSDAADEQRETDRSERIMDEADAARISHPLQQLPALDEALSPDENDAHDDQEKPPAVSAPNVDKRMQRRADLDRLFERIESENLAVVPIRIGNRDRFTVPALSGEGTELLAASPVLATKRLGVLYRIQYRKEVSPLLGWLAGPGKDPTNLRIKDRSANPGGAPLEIKNAFRRWKGHPEIAEALSNEAARRDALQRVSDTSTTKAGTVAKPAISAGGEYDRDARYPDPKDAATRQVRQFIALLHQGASADRLRDAAAEIAREPAAVEDVGRHRIELREAYREHFDEIDPFDRSRGRSSGVGKT